MESGQADARRLDADRLMDAAMDVARGGGCSDMSASHARLVKAARQFAMIAEPAREREQHISDCAVSVHGEGFRVVVRLRRGMDSLTISGPPKMAMAWIVDEIDASEAAAASMLCDVAVAWPRGDH